ncbi:uncharacterized protein LOC129582717 [Paramacrobiotus metropolitanus]|uniref:uncharacterized protein LOC129582717 n=1 Tax=Paramacrobiotus metropolitanus TaxID=2943436 RepID=UPI0024461CD6|nr:uncharacterized protein LOC129582717 [Paramacrobiotus metropolitanus]
MQKPILLFALPLGILLSWAAPLNGLPHPSCTYSPNGEIVLHGENLYDPDVEKLLDCKKVPKLRIPSNFDVYQVPTAVKSIDLGCSRRCVPSEYCARLETGFLPLPARPELTSVQFSGFEGPLPFGWFLANVKDHLTTLKIGCTPIGHLDADALRGFSALTRLDLKHAQISTIDPIAFANLGASPSKLASVSLGGNSLQEIDLSWFEPVKESLTDLEASYQKPPMSSLKLSGPEFQLALKTLDVVKNGLRVIPPEVLKAIRPRPGASTHFAFQSNGLCREMDCSCCAMEGFMRWAVGIQSAANKVTFECVYTVEDPSVYVPDQLYQNCGAK